MRAARRATTGRLTGQRIARECMYGRLSQGDGVRAATAPCEDLSEARKRVRCCRAWQRAADRASEPRPRTAHVARPSP